MKTFLKFVVILVFIAAAGFGGFWYGRQHPSAAPEADDQTSADSSDIKPVASVTTTPITRGVITRKIIAYGSVTAQPSDIAVLSVPYECRVVRVLAMPGQRLASPAPVIQIEPSPDTKLQFVQAKAALDAAKKDLAQAQRRFTDHLATNQDVLQSQTNLDAAQVKFDAMTNSGATEMQELKASGLIAKVDVQEGQIIPAGGPLVESAASSKIQARLGVEPSDISLIHQDDAVTIAMPAASDAAFAGKVALITQRINPTTSLIDVFVSLPTDCNLPLDGFVRGELSINSANGLIVPRSAALPEDEGYTLFTVVKGKAVKHEVAIVQENDQFAEITGENLAVGDSAVVTGNYELDADMLVSESAATEPSTQVSTQPVEGGK